MTLRPPWRINRFAFVKKDARLENGINKGKGPFKIG